MTDYDKEEFQDLPFPILDAIEDYGNAGFAITAKKTKRANGFETIIEGVRQDGASKAAGTAASDGIKKFVIRFTSETVTEMPTDEGSDQHIPKSMPELFRKAIEKLLNYCDYYWIRALDTPDVGIAQADLGFTEGIAEAAAVIEHDTISIVVTT
jgi:hypothetical protein